MKAFAFALLAASLATTIANAQWDIQDSGTTASLRGISSVGKGIAWASGTKGTVLRTEDAGHLWQHCTVPPDAAALDFRGIQAFDAKAAVIMSSGKGTLSRLYKTTDGCQTWKLLFTNPDPDGFWDFLRAEPLPDGKMEILLIGDPVGGALVIYGSLDGEKDYHRMNPGGLTSLDGEGLFAASNSSADINQKIATVIFGTGGPKGARLLTMCFICQQKDGWKSQTLPTFASGEGAGIFSLKNHGTSWVAVGGNYGKPAEAANAAAFSKDGGKTWALAGTFPGGYRSAVDYDAQTATWITVGPNGTDISTDDGAAWHALKPAPGSAASTDANWNALSLPFVVGPKGRIGVLRADALKPAK